MKPACLMIAAASLAGVAQCWWCDGHMLTASVAWNSGIMTEVTKTKVTSLINDPTMSGYPTSPDFITSGCWADDLKATGAPQEANWHFIDIPVVDPSFSGTLPPLPTADSAPWAITQGQSTVYSSKSSNLDRARQLRFLVHLVGDLHQPLHAAALFSSQFPNGDAGGNLFPVAGVDYTNELHAVWDSGAGQWTGDILRPLNATGQAWIDDFTTKVITAWPVSTLQPYINEYNVSAWANESNDIAATFAYTAPQAPADLPAAYIDEAQSICIKQIAIGGYRLADLLEYIFTVSPAWNQAAADAELRLVSKSEAEMSALRAREGPAPGPLPAPRLRLGRN